jgi:hypothetical protein
MPPFWISRAASPVFTLLVTACVHSPAPTPSATPLLPSPHGTAVNPANIKRVVRDFPPGYEMTSNIPSAVAPEVTWGLGADASEIMARPGRCAALADPGIGRDQFAQGVSGSGPGGIIDAVVVALPGPVDLDGTLVAACGRWTMKSGRTTAAVRLAAAPHVDGAQTLGMVADLRSVVESGTQIDSRAYTFIAYLGNYYAFTTLITDPGAALPALSPQFAADLLVKTVSTLRG